MVIGAGVLGLCCAVELERRGHGVQVVDPGGRNASWVAAGMIAPALESAIEDVTPARAALLRRARDLWPDLAEAEGIELHRRPAEWRGEGADVVAERLAALGFSVRHEAGRVVTDDDWQVDCPAALEALRQALARPVIAAKVEALAAHDGGWSATLSDGGSLTAPTLVLATGAGAAIPGLPDRVAVLVSAIEPVRGQIGWTAAPLADHVVRGSGGYLAPQGGGTLIGATMEAGRRDLASDPASSGALTAAAERLATLDPATPIDWRVGVRGATADGLPLAGPSGEAGLHLALAPRRNGWLLGPLVGRVVADGIEGRSGEPALDPLRL
ncbi:FAD-dependent oxidoreductase [Brevundimonas sp. S30B]|nr:FAD-dependent oxidoreductase [Brevundimonas sp. MF30-B]TFW02257.1 FAD-dependent oxidoreductase [Brevundimonas sp. S30B]